jgi:predicted transcriptional regulator
MTALTVRLPDDTHARLKAVARKRGVSVNRLIEEMTTLLLAESDLETRFAVRAARGRARVARGIELIEKAAAKRD